MNLEFLKGLITAAPDYIIAISITISAMLCALIIFLIVKKIKKNIVISRKFKIDDSIALISDLDDYDNKYTKDIRRII